MAVLADGPNPYPLSDCYETPMHVAWNFDYESPVQKLENPTTVQKRINGTRRTSNRMSVDPSNPIISTEHSQSARMPFFNRLSHEQRETFLAHSTAQLLSQFLHGEQGALMTAAVLTHSVPDIKAKYYAATQLPMHDDEREELAQFAFDAVKILVDGQSGGMDPGFLSVLEKSGIAPDDFVKGIKEAAELGIQRELPPGQIHSLEYLMIPALVRTGLVTPRTKALFEQAHIPVNVDLSVLEAMEDQTSDVNALNAAGASH